MKQTSISLTEAKTNLSLYGSLAKRGRTTLVCKHNQGAFLIAPLPQGVRARRKMPGLVSGQIRMEPDFDVTPEAVIRSFEGAS